ncbi:MAG: hypothetical protein U1A78_25225 [Polyangia bacterium]
MRLSPPVRLLVTALCAGLLVGACQVRNAQRCQLPEFPCEGGTLCKLDPGSTVGTCADECSRSTAGALTTCPDDRPICGADGACRACAADAECQERGAARPRCVDKMCAACRDSRDCGGDPLRPVCDADSHTCRPCALHGECADHVCAKDDTLAGLTDAAPLRAGQCVPAARQVVPDRGCTDSCLRARVLELSPERPYLRLGGLINQTGLTLSKPLNTLPVLHVVTDTADFSPAQLATAPTVELRNGAMAALLVNAGVDAVLEGLTFDSSIRGLECAGTAGAPSATRVRVLRSLFASNTTGITSRSCELRIEDSWLGIGPPIYGNPAVKGNELAMDLDTTRFEIVNTVLVRNAPRFGLVGFSGIRISNTQGAAQPGRILHTTFARQDTVANGGHAMAIDCTYNVAASLTVVNSLFLSEAPVGVNSYLAPSCRGVNVTYNGSNDPALAGPGSRTDLTYGDVFVAAPELNSPRVKASAGPLVRRGTADVTGLPARDQAGRQRPSANAAYGAFEPEP